MVMEGLYLCSNCRTRVEREHIRFDGSGFDLVCDLCLSRKQKKDKLRNPGDVQSVIEERRLMHRVQENTKNYYCVDCRYKFSRKSSFFIMKCPFCASTSIRQEISQKAQDLLDSVGDEEDLY